MDMEYIRKQVLEAPDEEFDQLFAAMADRLNASDRYAVTDYDHGYFKGKTAVVTGGASGIGLALAEEMLESGAAAVVIADINKDGLAEQAARLNAEYPGRVKDIKCDVTNETDVQKLIDLSQEFFGGRIDILFNNAGAPFAGWFEELNDEDWKKAFDLNFYGALYGMRAVLPVMKKQGGGQIINTISGIAFQPMAQQSRYAATKAALKALSLTARSEYWDDNIKVSPATPGTTATAIFKGHDVPQSAQTPHQSAIRILNGVVNNDRIIFGEHGDVIGGRFGNSPEAGKNNDEFHIGVTRERREGKVGL